MNQQKTVALAIGVGYLLGRRHKLGCALALGAAAATCQFAQGPLARTSGGEGVGGASSLSRLGGAARTALGKPLEMLTERINESAEALRQAGKPKEAASEQPQGGQQQPGEQPQGGQQQPGEQPQGGQQQEAANSVTGG